MVENQDLQDVVNIPETSREIETTRYPWMYKEFKKARVGSKFKILMLVGLGIFLVYLMFKWFSWYFLLGFLPAPAWFFWALRQIDKESFILIEIRIKGDEYVKGKISENTETKIYDIPPDVWKTIEKKGSPYHAGNRIYICDYYHEDDEGEKTIYFSEHPELSNMSFMAKAELWFELKKKLPEMEKNIAKYRYNSDLLVQERVTSLLEELGVLEIIMARGPVVRSRTLKEEKSNV